MAYIGQAVFTRPLFESGISIRFDPLGRVREEDMRRSFIFDAAKAYGLDPLKQFYGEDLAELDWLRDYLMQDDFGPPEDDFEAAFKLTYVDETEEMYSKADITSIPSDSDFTNPS